MNDPKLSKEEKQILKDFEAGEFKSILTPKRKKMLQAAAEETFKKDKRINIRISSRDLESLQRRALEEGIPYQTLVSSVLHKYVSKSNGVRSCIATSASSLGQVFHCAHDERPDPALYALYDSWR